MFFYLVLVAAALSQNANGAPAATAALTPVSNWGGINPAGMTMAIYVPAKVAPSPAVILAVGELMIDDKCCF